jgi:hypothetical protein
MTDQIEERKYAADVGAAGGFSLSPGAVGALPAGSPVLEDVGTVWDPARFAVPLRPLTVGRVEDRERFSEEPATRVGNAPVKFPGTEYRFPAEVACATEALQVAIDCEHAVNPRVDEYYAYLTVDRDVIPAGIAQRGFGAHADWLQGTRVAVKRLADHGYMCTDRDPPEFFHQPFELSEEDVANDAYNRVFEQRADPASVVRVEPYDVVLFDSYCVHGAIPATATAQRTFIRFFYSVGIYDRHGDTHNSLFDYHWEMDYRARP